MAAATPLEIAHGSSPAAEDVHNSGINCENCRVVLTEVSAFIGETALPFCKNCWDEGEDPCEFPAANYNWSKDGGETPLSRVIHDLYPGVLLSQLTEDQISDCILEITSGPNADAIDRDWAECYETPRNSPIG